MREWKIYDKQFEFVSTIDAKDDWHSLMVYDHVRNELGMDFAVYVTPTDEYRTE